MKRITFPSAAVISLSTAFSRSLELAAVLRPGDEGPHVEGEDPLVLEPLGDVAQRHPLREPLHDGRLADAPLADEHGVVLGPPREDLDHPADLVVPADDRVELLAPRRVRQVAAILVESLVLRLWVLVGDPLAPPEWRSARRGSASRVAPAFRSSSPAFPPASDANARRKCSAEIYSSLNAIRLFLGLAEQRLEAGRQPPDTAPLTFEAGRAAHSASARSFCAGTPVRASISPATPPSCRSRAANRCSPSTCECPLSEAVRTASWSASWDFTVRLVHRYHRYPR
jgi:hypothetical protein